MASISSLGIGSGLDLNGLLDQLESAERQQLAPIVRQQKSYQAEISAFGKLEGALSQFQEAAKMLAESSLFKSVTSEVTGSALTAAAGPEAVPGSYRVEVEQLAQASSRATLGVADKEAQLGSGQITFSFGNGETLEVDIAEGESSLEDIRDAINAKNGGVQASLVNDGSSYRLALSSRETGTDAAISNVAFGGIGLTMDASAGTEARDAALKVNGITITSQNNQVEGAIQGVTLNLEEAGADATATLNIKRDDAGIEKAITGFVDAYNGLQSNIAKLTRFDAKSGTAGELLGNSTLRNVESRLRNVMGSGAPGEFGSLADIGISLKLDGSLKLDKEKLGEIVAEQPAALKAFFAGEGTDETDSVKGGFAGNIDKALGLILEDDGLLDNATSGLETRIEGLSERYARTEKSIDATISRYRSQFSQLDGMIASMNSTTNYLTQQFDNMNAQLGRK
ncbi:flagellar filament capping protein FliD [Pistricoccus aurantiacus]|uniref:flagellar filament capping protein FliD n=1 Tax=Pistricoccus aurantiacus TaxID=1883414 RepID=UPI0036276D62